MFHLFYKYMKREKSKTMTTLECVGQDHTMVRASRTHLPIYSHGSPWRRSQSGPG